MKNMLIEIFKPTPIELTLEELEKKLYGRIIAGKTKENILNDFNQAGLACYVIGKIVEKDQFDIYVR